MNNRRNKRSQSSSNLLFTAGFASLFSMVLIFYLTIGSWIENMKDDQKSNSNSILQLNIERERLKIKQEALYLDRNILKLAKKNINKNAQQASPKGSIYVGRTND